MGLFRSKASEGGERRTTTVEERLAAIQPGVPGHCPSCEGLGYIDNLDIGGRFQIQHCKDCGHRWEYLFDADGHVVGLTELDDEGQPLARMRVRTRPLVADRVPDDGDDDVLDLRDPAPVDGIEAGVADDAETDVADDAEATPEQMSAAEWLRHAVGR